MTALAVGFFSELVHRLRELAAWNRDCFGPDPASSAQTRVLAERTLGVLEWYESGRALLEQDSREEGTRALLLGLLESTPG